MTRTPVQTIVSQTLDVSASAPRPILAEPIGLSSAAAVNAALQSLPVPVVIFDDELRLHWSNDAARLAFQLPANADKPESISTYLPEIVEQRAALLSLDRDAECSFKVTVRRPEKVVTGTARVKAVATGASPLFSMSIADLREPREVLTQSVDALSELLATLPHMLMVLNRDLNVLFANHDLLGYASTRLRQMHIGTFLPADVHDHAIAAMKRTLATGEVERYGGRIVDGSGKTRHYSVCVNAIRHDGEVLGLTLIAGDTTEQVVAEHAIATQAQIIDSMLEGVAVVDEKGFIHITNPAFDALFGHERGSLLGRELRSLALWPFANSWNGNAVGESMVVEFEARRRTGESFAAAGVLSGFDIAGRNHSLLVLQDVSERKQLERGVLQAVNREQYRIGNDLHDGLGQELTGIALMLRGLAGRLTTEYSPELEGITRLVNNAIESTRALARGLSPVNLERGGLQDALEGLAMHASELYGVQIIFTHRVSQSALNPELANHLYRIAQESVRNAVRHGKARSIRLHLAIARAKVKLSITDDGVGMPPDAMDASGMGLKIMCYRARIVGGDVSFESVQPTGTRVVCECPLEAGAAARIRKLPKLKARA